LRPCSDVKLQNVRKVRGCERKKKRSEKLSSREMYLFISTLSTAWERKKRNERERECVCVCVCLLAAAGGSCRVVYSGGVGGVCLTH